MIKFMHSLFASAILIMAVDSISSVAVAEDTIDWECQVAYQRGIEAVNWAIPAVSMLNFRKAYFGLGGGFR